MKTLLIFLAIVLIAAGWAVGLINIFSPGTVTVGLNLDVAATLFVGGCVLLGLAVVAGYLSALTRRETDDVAAEDYAPAASTETDLPDFMAPASAVAAGAAAGVAASASAFGDTAKDTAEASADVVEDLMDDIRSEAKPAVESAGSIFNSVTGTATEVADEAVDKAEEIAGDAADKVEEVTGGDAVDKARDDLSSFFSKPADTSAAPEAVEPSAFTAAPDVKPGSVAAEETDAESEAKPELSDTNDDADADTTSIFSGASPAKAGGGGADAAAVDTTTPGVITMDAATTDAPEAEAVAEEPAASASEGSQDVETTPEPEVAPEQEIAPEQEVAPEPAAESAPEALPQEDELFVVEERVIRERPARLLSDGTVEAETDEGWMRFENVEHVEEYLDAMRATA